MADISYLGAAVGLGAPNVPRDVTLIQKMLKSVSWRDGGPTKWLQATGTVSPDMVRAIWRYQNRTLKSGSGRIDPGSDTETALIEHLTENGKIFKVLDDRPDLTPPPGTTRQPEKPLIKGGITPIRRLFLSTLLNLMPPLGQTKQAEEPKVNKNNDTGEEDTSAATGCGGLPGRIWRAIGVPGKGKPGSINFLAGSGKWRKVISPTGHSPHWDTIAKKIDEMYGSRCWVPFKPGLKPKPGDIYVQRYADAPFFGQFRHVGIVFSVTGNTLLTADAGQGSGWDLAWNERTIDHKGQSYNIMNEHRQLAGWCDIDELYGVFVGMDPLRYRI